MPLISVSCRLRLLFMKSLDSRICLRHLFSCLINHSWLGALCPHPCAERTWWGLSKGKLEASVPRGKAGGGGGEDPQHPGVKKHWGTEWECDASDV